MDAGFTILLFLFILGPLLNLSWFIAEIAVSVKRSRQRVGAVAIIMPSMAAFFLMESVAIDLYLISQARM